MDPELARQVLEYVFARAWACRESFEDEDWFVFFLYSEAALRLKEIREKAEDEFFRLAVEVAGGEKERELDRSVFMGKVWDAVERLPRQRRMAILEHFIAGKPVKQIAAEKSLKEQTVWNHLHRGLSDLREVLNGRLVNP
jgi:RNA polymerase sigma factor (sigma-70 family)